MLQVVGHVDRSHPAFTKLALDRTAAFQYGIEADNWVGQERTPGSDLVNIRERARRRKEKAGELLLGVF